VKTNAALGLLALIAGGALALPAGAADPAPVTISLNKDQQTLEFRAGKDLVARYHAGPSVAKPYFWPLNGPGGVPVTRAWPMEKGQPGESTDHVHQKSAWFCHGDVIPEGMELKHKIKGVDGVDFWAEGPGHGRIVCTRVDEPQARGNRAQVTTHNEWRTADDVKVLDEERTIRLIDLGGARLFVVDIDLHATVVPITFGDTKEGSFGIRISDRITEEKREGKKVVKGDGRIENADNKVGEKACWGQVSRWCDYSGPIEGKVMGVAIFDDPSNPSPACWHSRGYGLMAANPFGRARSGFPAMKERTDLIKLSKGEHVKLRYGLLIHSGDAREGKVAEFYERFVSRKDFPQ
jgi:hypothetical protein